MPDEYRKEIITDAAQRAAIRHLRGPCLVTAGPGSGKTRVLTCRAVHLTARCNISPDRILVLTFSKAAAGEMRQRFLSLAPHGSEDIRFYTFHAFCFELLRTYRGGRIDAISGQEKMQLISSIIKRFADPGTDPSISGTGADEAARMISLLKCGRQDAIPDADGEMGRFMKAVRKEYDIYLRQRGLLDFDDMILEGVRLLSQNARILQKVREECAFIMVDEFQDVSPAQFAILRLIAGSEGNLFAVGDDDQSIYGFRGAGPGIFHDFIHTWEDVRLLQLNINYRCPAQVVSAAGKVIRHNTDRIGKQIICGSGCRGEVHTAAFTGRKQQYTAIAEQIRSRRSTDNTGGKADSICILVRMSGQAAAIRRVLEEEGVLAAAAVRRAGRADAAVMAYLEDLIAYAEASLQPAASERISGSRENGPQPALRRILNRPERGLRFYSGEEHPDPVCEAFLRKLAFAGRLRSSHWYRYVMDTLDYGSFFRQRILPELTAHERETAGKIRDLCLTNSPLPDLLRGLRDLAAAIPESAKPKEAESIQSAVRIMTMHTAKGLEFDTVFLPDLNEGILPARAAKSKAAVEEERRLFYVAMTRAAGRLFMSFVEDPENGLPPVSRFLVETGTAYSRGRF